MSLASFVEVIHIEMGMDEDVDWDNAVLPESWSIHLLWPLWPSTHSAVLRNLRLVLPRGWAAKIPAPGMQGASEAGEVGGADPRAKHKDVRTDVLGSSSRA